MLEKSVLTTFSGHDEHPLAYVVLKDGHKATEKEVQDFLSKQVTRTKRLTGGVRFVDVIPKNPVSTCADPCFDMALNPSCEHGLTKYQ